MIVRWNRWYSETEIVWIKAANTLPAFERAKAFSDISDMTGRDFEAVRVKANKMRHDEAVAIPMAALNLGPKGRRYIYQPLALNFTHSHSGGELTNHDGEA